MLSEKAIEAKYGITTEEVEKWAEPWEAGDVPDNPVGKIIIGRPLKFGESMRPITFKETESKINEINERAQSLGMQRSDYIRWLIDKDLATAS